MTTTQTTAAAALHAAIDTAHGRACGPQDHTDPAWAEIAHQYATSYAPQRDQATYDDAAARDLMTEIVDTIGDLTDTEVGAYTSAIWAIAVEADADRARRYPSQPATRAIEILTAATAAMRDGFTCTQK